MSPSRSQALTHQPAVHAGGDMDASGEEEAWGDRTSSGTRGRVTATASRAHAHTHTHTHTRTRTHAHTR
eukprot:8478388-Prorocentrum_lima.AAC.1